MEEQIQTVSKFVDTVVQFAVAYGFQIVGALVFLFVGLKVAVWAGQRMTRLIEAKKIDPTLARFLGNISRLVVIAFVAVITLGNFGISIAPLIALAGASAFGATIAIQGPLSNYGAGLSIIMSRPFVVGNTISVRGVSGVVQEVTLAVTVLVGEDGERITIPNKEIVGRVIVNSDRHRVVESKIAIDGKADVGRAIAAIKSALDGFAELKDGPAPQVGLHDFTYGGVVIGMRFWVPSKRYFQNRYAINEAALRALKENGIGLASGTIASSPNELSADSAPSAANA